MESESNSVTLLVFEGELVPFKSRLIFNIEQGWADICELKILANEKLLLEEDVIFINDLQKLFQDGVYSTRLPEACDLIRTDCWRVQITNTSFWIKESEFIKEIEDIQKELCGSIASLQVCRSVLKEYLESPTEENHRRLRIAYENVPQHHRLWITDFENKDLPLRQILNLEG